MLPNKNAVTPPIVQTSHTFAWQLFCPVQCLVHQCTSAGWHPLLLDPAPSLQDRPRRPPLSFTSPHPEGRNLGFILEHGRCTATAQTEGVLRTACWEEGFGPRHDPRGGPAPLDPHSCYTVVQPGLVSGSMYVELLVQSTQPASRGPSGLRIWVVRLDCLLAQHCARLQVCSCCLHLEVLEPKLCATN